jgi:hypothetical protein
MQWFAQIRKLRSLVTKNKKTKEKGESGGFFPQVPMLYDSE